MGGGRADLPARGGDRRGRGPRARAGRIGDAARTWTVATRPETAAESVAAFDLERKALAGRMPVKAPARAARGAAAAAAAGTATLPAAKTWAIADRWRGGVEMNWERAPDPRAPEVAPAAGVNTRART